MLIESGEKNCIHLLIWFIWLVLFCWSHFSSLFGAYVTAQYGAVVHLFGLCIFTLILLFVLSLSQIATIVLHGIDWIMPLLVICLVLLRWNNLWEVYTRRLLIRLWIERHNDNAQNQQYAFFIQIKFVNQQMLPSKLVNYYNSATMIHRAHNCLTEMLIK